MTYLVGGASTQSRANRPLPEGWDAVCIHRGGIYEEWHVKRDDGGPAHHRIDVTWIFDQGGPILGYTSRRNSFTLPLLRTVDRLVDKYGLFGPGGIASILEHEAADALIGAVGEYLLPDDLAMRWLANGSDATDCAVRLARAFTNRTKFISCGYHGSSVIFAHKPQNKGVPASITTPRISLRWNDTKRLRELFKTQGDKIACMIVEVPSEDKAAKKFLAECQKLCAKNGAIFILDEVVTGFRLALGGAAEHYDIKPDIACYGKAMSNGRGISAVVGPREVMELLEKDVFYSNTYNGDPYNCAHVIATLQTVSAYREDLYSGLWEIGNLLSKGLNELGVKTAGHAPRATIKMKDKEKNELTRKLIPLGILLGQPNYIAAPHTDESVSLTLRALEEVKK
jgi:glutamate-1-semialdehyde aminotransferase